MAGIPVDCRIGLAAKKAHARSRHGFEPLAVRLVANHHQLAACARVGLYGQIDSLVCIQPRED